MPDNIVNIPREHTVEDRLRQDAKKINAEVSPQLRESLISQLSPQFIQSDHTCDDLKRDSIWKNPLSAIAATLIVSVLSMNLYFSPSLNTKDSAATHESSSAQLSNDADLLSNSIHSKNQVASYSTQRLSTALSSPFGDHSLLESKHLKKEYHAILSDIEMLKNRIAKL